MNEKITIIGCGNWGSAISKVIGNNLPNNIINLWVHEEIFEGEKLSSIINQTRENKKYLPGIILPKNVYAIPGLEDACKDVTILVFVLPSSFLENILNKVVRVCNKDTIAVSLIKSIYLDDKPVLVSSLIRKYFSTSVLMGANIAMDVAKEQLTESTLGGISKDTSRLLPLFNNKNFIITCTEDYVGVEAFGGLKNIVAIGAGFSDGLELGCNTKATIIRIGLKEILRFCKYYFSPIDQNTILESCGIADIMTTCYGGRNRKCAEEFIRNPTNWYELEINILKGQKLEGIYTCEKVYKILSKDNLLNKFPLFHSIYKISFENDEPMNILQAIPLSVMV